ncbi:MAG: 6-pyruvoyl trahydropterin synthase family protein [Candidatus Kariarchaeaceae archaeon]
MKESTSQTYSLTLSDPRIHFSSAHFVIGEKYCEGIHGHDYSLKIELEAKKTINDMVMDFLDLKPWMKKIASELDHRMILPAINKELKITVDEKSNKVEINLRESKFYEIPLSDTVILPISNSTVEEIARYIAEKLEAHLKYHKELTKLKVTVGEYENQEASCIITLNV